MHSLHSDVSTASQAPEQPCYAYDWPAAATAVTNTNCYCHLCTHDRPSPAVPAASMPEVCSRSHSRALPEREEEGVAVQEGPRGRRSFPSQSRLKGSREKGLERNGVNGGGQIPPKNLPRKVDFYLGPDHCSVLGDSTPGFPRGWDACYSPPPRWNWPATEPCREHCECTREVWPEWERTPLPPPPPLPSPPHLRCYSPERRPHSASRALYQPSSEFRGYLRHREVLHGGMGEPCWECVRDHYWREAHRPDLIAVDPVCGCSGNRMQRNQALSPVLSYGPEPMGRQHQHQHQQQHQRLSRQTSPEHGTFNGPTTPGARTFFSTEVPPAKLRVPYKEEPSSSGPKVANGPLRREPKLETHKQREKDDNKKEKEKCESVSGTVNQQQDQGNVREQIRRVVDDLEGVLGGLKQVHLEMQEVVQQIDVLTSSIDISNDEPGRRISHESVQQQQTVRHEVKALVHRPAGAHASQKPKHQQLQQEQQPQGVNGLPTPTVPAPTPSSNPSTCHSSVTQRGHAASGDLPQVTALIPGQEAVKDRSKMNGTCVAPRPPRDRVKDAQRRRIELTSPSVSLTPNGNAASLKNHKPPPYPNHNGRVETIHKDSEVPMGALRAAASTGKGRQVSTAV